MYHNNGCLEAGREGLCRRLTASPGGANHTSAIGAAAQYGGQYISQERQCSRAWSCTHASLDQVRGCEDFCPGWTDGRTSSQQLVRIETVF